MKSWKNVKEFKQCETKVVKQNKDLNTMHCHEQQRYSKAKDTRVIHGDTCTREVNTVAGGVDVQ
jgi:hypothetical protein